MADLQTIKLLVNTPDRVFYHDDATFVELSTSEGDIGVYPGHIPLTAVVVPCKESCGTRWNYRDSQG